MGTGKDMRNKTNVSNISETAKNSPFKSMAEIIGTKPPTWTIHGILPNRGYGVIYGKESAGKTALVFEMLLAISTGRSIFERQTKPGLTLHISGEGNTGLGNRAQAWMDANGIEDPNNVPMRFFTDPFNLLDEGGIEAFIHRLRSKLGGQPLKCICVDTLNRAMMDGDENSARDVGRAVAACEKIARELDCFVFVVHHQPKSSSDDDPTPRGSNVISANADTVLHVRKDGSEMRVHLQKQKDAPDNRSFLFRLEDLDLGFTDDDGYPQTARVATYDCELGAERLPKAPELNANQAAILDLLCSTSPETGIHFEEWYKTALSRNVIGGEKPKRAFTNAVKRLVTYGLVAGNDNEVYRPVDTGSPT